MKTGAKIAIGVGAAGVLGTIAYFVFKKPGTSTVALPGAAKPTAVPATSSTNSTQQALNTVNNTVQASQQLVSSLLPTLTPTSNSQTAPPPAQPSTFPSKADVLAAAQTVPAAVADKNFMAALQNYDPNSGTFTYGNWKVYITNNNPITFTLQNGSQKIVDASTYYPAYMDNTLSGFKRKRALGSLLR